MASPLPRIPCRPGAPLRGDRGHARWQRGSGPAAATNDRSRSARCEVREEREHACWRRGSGPVARPL